MPVPSFLSNFADKAQAAVNASPLAGHLPASLQNRAASPDASSQPSANHAAAQGGAKNHTLENIQYQIRSLQQQYSSNTTPVQKIVTAEKGVVIDFDNISRNSKAQSKELYTWGQSEHADLKDVTDRLAYLNFVQGSLAASLAGKLDTARGPFKALRDSETALQPRRNIRASLQTQIARLEHESQKSGDKRIADLREQLRRAEQEDQQLEKELDLMKRKAVRESERIKWDAIREYGEKLVLLSQAATPIIDVLPSLPPTQASPYTGAQTTGAVRASLQRALDNYKTGHINLPSHMSASDLDRSDTRSFGESHASELSNIYSDAPRVTTTSNSTPSPISSMPLPEPYPHSSSTGLGASAPQHVTSPPINPHSLNNSPAAVPNLSPSSAPSAGYPPSIVPHGAISPILPVSDNSVPPPLPTVAETGIPITSSGGPGPASGSLQNIHAAADNAGPRSGNPFGSEANLPGYGQSSHVAAPVPQHESAIEEKRRLAALYSQPSGGATQQSNAGPPPPAFGSGGQQQAAHHESAEEEKKRLEREERERILHAGGSGPHAPPKDNSRHDDGDLPPYQEPGQH